jgi:hypothetical protein
MREEPPMRMTEFIAWARACAVDEQDAFARFLAFQADRKGR